MTENQQQGNSYQNPQPQNIYIRQTSAESNGMGTAGFIISLAAIFLGWIPLVGWFLGSLLWLLGLIFSFIGIFKKPRGLAIAGLVISLLGIIILFFLFGILAVVAVSSSNYTGF